MKTVCLPLPSANSIRQCSGIQVAFVGIGQIWMWNLAHSQQRLPLGLWFSLFYSWIVCFGLWYCWPIGSSYRSSLQVFTLLPIYSSLHPMPWCSHHVFACSAFLGTGVKCTVFVSDSSVYNRAEKCCCGKVSNVLRKLN